jgi:hypothetical protein
MSLPRTAAAVIAAGRLAFGVGLFAVPERIASGWLGPDAGRAPAKIALRGLGARDIAISAGTLAALRGDDDRLAQWVAAAIGCDASDVLATLLAPSDALPGNARWGTVALGGGTALAGVAVLTALRPKGTGRIVDLGEHRRQS